MYKPLTPSAFQLSRTLSIFLPIEISPPKISPTKNPSLLKQETL